jgi:uncharacterized protein Yka (UPF0111/DUF47 family)
MIEGIVLSVLDSREVTNTEQIREEMSRVTDTLSRQAEEIHGLMERLLPLLEDLEHMRKRWAWMIPKSR